MKILTVFGTRPEAIKLAPVVRALAAAEGVKQVVCTTGQHRQMLGQVLDAFQITPDHELDIMKPGQDLTYVTTAILEKVGGVIDAEKPDWVIVQGDTTTAFAGALAAFYRQVAVAHVEAGLRTGNKYSPWPEEINRQLVGRMASLHFPPTDRAAKNLTDEGVPANEIEMTGNTVIDAIDWMGARIDSDDNLRREMASRFDFIDFNKRLILVTGHRRENFDGGLENVCKALVKIAKRGDVEIV